MDIKKQLCKYCNLNVIGKRNRYYCSQSCYDKNKSGNNNPKWRGGKVIIDNYRYIYNPLHPRATKDGYVCEHRLIMEKFLGRHLKAEEVVHHINRNKLDNKLNNLELLSNQAEHAAKHIKTRDSLGRFKYVY